MEREQIAPVFWVLTNTLWGYIIRTKEVRRMEEMNCPACHRMKKTPRSDEDLKQLKNRLNRITGQLSGIGRMLDENRYCGDILIQLAAVEKALQSLGYMILQEHMETCMVEDIGAGRVETVDEVLELIKKLK